MSEQRHRVRNGILLGMTLRPSASDAHIPPLSTTVRAFRISNNKTRSTVGPLIAPEHSHRLTLQSSDDRITTGHSIVFSNQTKSINVGLLIAPENTTPVPADTRASDLSILPYEPNHSTIRRTRADISKSVKKRRRSRERAEKEAGTCAHVRTIELGRKERKEYP
ncbi:hypothetical protein V1477_001658 [Vespula maculifrons]|uniref:Uncharacterized protein n=1 Tax=Vespula maculifrons TaxID=7453 RepID=A0ABD2CYF2_VESMC